MTRLTLETAKLEWKDRQTPVSRDFEDVYFSADDGCAESEFVFLKNNQLAERFAKLSTNHFTIGETGFGTGLNFLQACKLWRSHILPSSGKHLTFISSELFPLDKASLKQALENWPELEAFSTPLYAQYPLPIQGSHILHIAPDITLILLLGETSSVFNAFIDTDHPSYQGKKEHAIDAWFLDGFAPDKNPDMWSEDLFRTLAKLSHRNTTLATFTAAGFVRRGLMSQGFRVTKVPGFGRKREMITARYEGLPFTAQDFVAGTRNSKYQSVWHITPKAEHSKSATVIGAGIAGCNTALALANKGILVNLLDQHKEPMLEASGNPQAVIFPKLSEQHSDFNHFNLEALLYAPTFYQHYLTGCFHNTGVLQLLVERDIKSAKNLFEAFPDQEDFIQLVTPEQASKIAGTPIQNPALWYPTTGWVSPKAVRENILSHPSIKFTGNVKVNSLIRNEDVWELTTNTGKVIRDSAIVLSNAKACEQLLPDVSLPLKNIRGQVSIADCETPELNTVICHSGYICPNHENITGTTFGASYDLGETCLEPLQTSEAYNLEQLANYLQPLAKSIQKSRLEGRVAFRCASHDYLPLTGPIPDSALFRQRFKHLSKNAKANLPYPGEYLQGLYLNVGFGSRGFSTSPLCAEYLSRLIAGGAASLPTNLQKAIHPARFTVRDIIRKN